MYESLSTALLAHGYVVDPLEQVALESLATELGLSQNGSYDVRIVWTKTTGSTVRRVWVESNANPDDFGGFSALVQHPDTAVVDYGTHRSTCNPGDVDLVVALATA